MRSGSASSALVGWRACTPTRCTRSTTSRRLPGGSGSSPSPVGDLNTPIRWRELGFDRNAPNWEAVVSDPQVAVIANLAPDALHAPVSIAALQQGKPVLCEKP